MKEKKKYLVKRQQKKERIDYLNDARYTHEL